MGRSVDGAGRCDLVKRVPTILTKSHQDQNRLWHDGYRAAALSKLDLFNTLLEGDIVIGVDTESGQNWQIVRISLVFKAEPFVGFVES